MQASFASGYLISFILISDSIDKLLEILESFPPHLESLTHLYLVSSNQLSLANALILNANYDRDLEILDSDFSI